VIERHNQTATRRANPFHLYPAQRRVRVVRREEVVDGKRFARPVIRLRYSFDERVEDGLYCSRSLSILQQRLEDPASWIDVSAPSGNGQTVEAARDIS
jgi:hypothetical protein